MKSACSGMKCTAQATQGVLDPYRGEQSDVTIAVAGRLEEMVERMGADVRDGSEVDGMDIKS